MSGIVVAIRLSDTVEIAVPNSLSNKGFTLIEMLVVIAVIAVLSSLSAAAAMAVLAGGNEEGTRTFIRSLEVRMVDQGMQPLRLPSGQYLRRWDVNNDGYLDGRINPVIAQAGNHIPTATDPATDPDIDVADQQTYFDLEYQGVVHALSMTIDADKYVNPLTGRLRDLYGNELLIVFGKEFGPNQFGIISPGPDLQTDPDILDPSKRSYDPSKNVCLDDIVSWEHE